MANPAHTNRGSAPEDLGEGELLATGNSRDHRGSGGTSAIPDPNHIFAEANWQLLAAKLAHASSSSGKSVALLSRDLLKLLGGDNLSSCEIPSSVLDGALHLRDLNTKSG
jgi:hypothetical protein